MEITYISLIHCKISMRLLFYNVKLNYWFKYIYKYINTNYVGRIYLPEAYTSNISWCWALDKH